MLDIVKYKWLDTSNIKLDYDKKHEDYLVGYFDYLDKSKLKDNERNIYGQYIFHYLTLDNKTKLSNNYKLQLKSFDPTNSFKKFKDQVLKNDISAFTMASLMVIMCGTIVLFFLAAIFRQKFVINFSIDAIVGTIGLVLLVRNFAFKYKIIKRYTSSKDLLALDIVSFILCICLKLMIKQIDITLFILTISYLLSKQRLKKEML